MKLIRRRIKGCLLQSCIQFDIDKMSVIIRVISLFIAFASSTPVDKISITSEVIKDVTLSSALAYWSADCGDRAYVGSDGQY